MFILLLLIVKKRVEDDAVTSQALTGGGAEVFDPSHRPTFTFRRCNLTEYSNTVKMDFCHLSVVYFWQLKCNIERIVMSRKLLENCTKHCKAFALIIMSYTAASHQEADSKR